jgi:cation transport ATPase
LEKIAKANEFIVGKTGIITTGKLKVKKMFLEGKETSVDRADTLFCCELTDQTLHHI